MSDKTDLNIVSTDPTGKKQTTKISYVNPEASATQLYQLATKLMNTSQNTYQESSRVDTTELVDESGLLDRKMRWNSSPSNPQKTLTKTFAEIKVPSEPTVGCFSTEIYFEGGGRQDGELLPEVINETPYPVSMVRYTVTDSGSYPNICVFASDGFIDDSEITVYPRPYGGTITIRLPASDGYKSDEITLTITE